MFLRKLHLPKSMFFNTFNVNGITACNTSPPPSHECEWHIRVQEGEREQRARSFSHSHCATTLLLTALVKYYGRRNKNWDLSLSAQKNKVRIARKKNFPISLWMPSTKSVKKTDLFSNLRIHFSFVLPHPFHCPPLD